LLPFLLLILQIRIKKDITFKTYDVQTGIVLSNSDVDFTYPDRNFINFESFKFATYSEINRQKNTNKEGLATFELSYTLFHKLFYPKDTTVVIATGGCFQSDTLNPKYFELIKKDINKIGLSARRKIINFTVIDSLDGEVLPKANVIVDYYLSGQKQTFKAKSDARGIVEADILFCSDSIKVTAQKYGYKSYFVKGKLDKFDIKENRILPLNPILSKVEFIVKDLYTKKPIPNATAKLILENSTITAKTNTNGIGKGMFDSIAIAKKMYIELEHSAYFDTTSQKYIVEDFINLPEEKRIIYMRPKPGNFVFQNIDHFSDEPVPGVKNIVYVNGNEKGEFFSNSNGEFTVPDLSPKDNISIICSKENYTTNDYTIKNDKVSNLKNYNNRKIPMKPDLKPKNVEPPKPNCRAHFSGTLLSDKYIENHISIVYQADEYGEYVGRGEYPNNASAFPQAVDHTFDAIAVDKGTRVILYSKPNFQGKVILDVTGPALINNVKWKNENRIKNVNNKNLGRGLETLFPKSCRRWSSSDMNSWSHGSVKIKCNQ